MQPYRIIAIDPGSTTGFAIAELNESTYHWRMLYVGNTTGMRGVRSKLCTAFGSVRDPSTRRYSDPIFSGVVLLEDFHFRDSRTASTEATRTTIEIWGGVKWWTQTTEGPGGLWYPCVTQQPPDTATVRSWRKILGKNPHDPGQADHPYVAAAHIEAFLKRRSPAAQLLLVTEEVWYYDEHALSAQP